MECIPSLWFVFAGVVSYKLDGGIKRFEFSPTICLQSRLWTNTPISAYPIRARPFFSYSTRLALDYFTICMVFAIEKLKFILHIRRSTRNLTIFETNRPDPHLTKWYLHWTVLDYLGIRSFTRRSRHWRRRQFQIGFQFDSLNFVQILLVNDRIPKSLSMVQCKYHLVKCGSGRIGSKMVKLQIDGRIHNINFNLSMANTMRILK